ncbi:dTMP kinase [Pseudomonas luteola]
MKGRFLNFEGIDGSGKTTQIGLLCEHLKKVGIPFVTTREPGGTPIAEDLRDVLLRLRSDEVMHPMTELLVYFAARVQHYHTYIRPKLNEGFHVICDRFTPSTYAYQAAGRQIDLSVVKALDSLAMDSVKPDLTVYIDIDIEESSKRVNSRAPVKLDRMDLQKDSFRSLVRNGYLEQVILDPQRFAVVSGRDSIESVHRSVLESVMPLLKITKE